MVKTLKDFLKNHYLLIVVVGLAAILRFYRLADMAYLDFDQEYAANFAYSVIKEFPIQLIGQGLSVQGLFMGPIYFYYLTPFFAIFNLHPLGGTVGSVLLGLITIIAYYYFANKMFGKPAGLIAAFLRSILFSKLEVDWSMVPSYHSELLVLVTWYCFYQYWQGKTNYLPLLGLVFGLYTSFHPILIPFYFVFLVLVVIRRVWPNFKTLLLSFGAFILPVTPLILFEYFHKFIEVKLLIGLIFGPKSGMALSFAKILDYTRIIFNGPQNDLSININPPYLLSGIVLLLVLIFTIRRVGVWKESFHLFAIGVTLLVFVLYYYFLPVHVPEYYFLAPITLISFYFVGALGFLAKRSRGRVLVIACLIWVAFMNFRQLQYKWSDPNLVTLAHKDEIVKAILDRQPKNEEFFVSYLTAPGWNSGYKYLLQLYGLVPKDRPLPKANYTVVAPRSLSPDSIRVHSGNIGLIPPNEEY